MMLKNHDDMLEIQQLEARPWSTLSDKTEFSSKILPCYGMRDFDNYDFTFMERINVVRGL